jgi:subtilisin family serine protease
MKSLFQALLVIILLLVAVTTNAESKYAIRFEAQSQIHSLADAMWEEEYKVQRVIEELSIIVVRANSQEIEELKGQFGKEIVYIEESQIVSLDPLSPFESFIVNKGEYREAHLLWGMKSIRAPQAWKYEKGSEKTVIAISDTGILPSHRDLKDTIWENPGESGLDENGNDRSNNKIDDDGNGYIDDTWGWNWEADNNRPRENHFHGSHVSCTAAARGGNKGIVGVSWYASLISLKFLGMGGSGDTIDAAESIIYAANKGARVINCSWGGDYPSQVLSDAIDYALTQGLLIVAAAGNDRNNIDEKPKYPAAYPQDNILVVGAHTQTDYEPAGFSNFGRERVDIAAPGVDIFSCVNPMYEIAGRSYIYYALDGTSMAAPHVTGTAGLLYSINPQFSWKEVKEIILDTADRVPAWQGKSSTGGVLNAEAAVLRALSLSN